MKTSDKGLDLIKQFEGLRLMAYRCPAGVATIGYGHTAGVQMGDRITREQADAYLKEDVEPCEKAVAELVKAPLNQGQFDALVSFVFNLGRGALASSTMLKILNAKSYGLAAAQFERWCKAGGKVIPGLLKRRHAEAAIFLGEV